MKAWVDLYRAHQDARRLGSADWVGRLRQRLIALSEAGHCDPSIQGRFTYRRDARDAVEWSIRTEDEQAEPLCNIPSLASARLSLTAVADRRHNLRRFTLVVDGKRPDGSKVAIAVHLPDDRETTKSPDADRQGLGACSHAALHCHVGPDLDTEPKVRVPLPALGPVEALDWVLSQLVPTMAFEAAPWPAVLDAMKKASA